MLCHHVLLELSKNSNSKNAVERDQIFDHDANGIIRLVFFNRRQTEWWNSFPHVCGTDILNFSRFEMKMRIWCVPSATELERSPKLPPRIDRDVYLRSPPPPPRLSKEQKLARGVIVVNKAKSQKSSGRKVRKSSSSGASSKSSSAKSTLDESNHFSLPPPPPPRISPTSNSSNNSGSVIGSKSRNNNNDYFKAHITNGGSNSSIILHPGTSRSRQKKIKRRKRGNSIDA